MAITPESLARLHALLNDLNAKAELLGFGDMNTSIDYSEAKALFNAEVLLQAAQLIQTADEHQALETYSAEMTALRDGWAKAALGCKERCIKAEAEQFRLAQLVEKCALEFKLKSDGTPDYENLLTNIQLTKLFGPHH